MRTQWTTKGNRDAGSSCSCHRGLHRYFRNFGGGGWTPQTPPRYATGHVPDGWKSSIGVAKTTSYFTREYEACQKYEGVWVLILMCSCEWRNRWLSAVVWSSILWLKGSYWWWLVLLELWIILTRERCHRVDMSRCCSHLCHPEVQ